MPRRKFLGTTAAVAAGSLFPPSVMRLSAAAAEGETEYFYWSIASADGPWIDTQRGDRAFGYKAGKLFLSEDNAKSWAHEADFADAESIQFSSLLENGRVVFATERRIFVGNDDLSDIRELTVRKQDGGEYRPHSLRKGEVPGWYFYSLDGIHTFEVEGPEMLIWGNYCNVRTGPTPSNIYYSVDGGETVKIAYSFGQNPAFQYHNYLKDSKANLADRSNWVGDPDNSVVCRHIHSVSYNPTENAFYACCGDLDRRIGVGLECHWLRGVYDSGADAWNWKVIVSSDANSRYKSGGINCVDGKVYWVADANGPKTVREVYDRGIFRCKPEDIPNPAKHEMIYPVKYEMACMTIHGNTIVAPKYGNADPDDCGFLFSPDLGKTWGHYDLKELGDRSGVRVNPPNNEGWYRVQLMKGWIRKGEVMFLKPKEGS